MSEIYEDGFGNEYIIAEGEIKIGDMALNGDTGDVIYIDEGEDLFFRNETCQKLIEYVKPCETCGGEGEIWHSDYYCDMAYTCLLYTSPSPRDVLRSRMPSSA